MKLRLPDNLGPRAKRRLMRGPQDGEVSCVVELAIGTTPSSLSETLSALGIEQSGWSPSSHLLTLQTPASALADLAALSGVVYVELAQKYSH